MIVEQIATAVTCKNCSAEVEFSYCPMCGQKKTVQRLTFNKVYKEFIQDYLGFDKGVVHTTKSLLLTPGTMINEYLAGRRKPYLKPLQYYLIMLTLYFVISSLFGIDLMQLGQDITKDAGLQSTSTNPQVQQKMQKFNEVFNSNLKVISTLMVPIMALALLLLYRKKKYNYTELLVFALYTYGVSLLFYAAQNLLLALPLSVIVSKFLFYSLLLLGNVYVIFATQQFFITRGFLAVLKASMALVLSYLFYLVIVSVLYVVLYFI